MKKSITFLVIILFSCAIKSQDINYSALLIPPELKENAKAVIRDCSLEITIEAANKMLVHKRKTITVLNKDGNDAVDLYQHYDNDTKISKLSAIIYDITGKEIKHYKTKDFEDASAISGGTLYSDSRVKYLDYTPISYPYTVVFETSYKTSTTGFIPRWIPIDSYRLSLQKSTLIVRNPTGIEWRHKNLNFEDFEINFNKTDTEITASTKNIKAIGFERNSVSFDEIFPETLIALNKSYLKGVYGEYKNWLEFGKWMNDKMLAGRNVLNEETVKKVKELTEGVNNDVEKAKILYKYMQDKTRYISVQVGIGGWEPIPASEVDEVGYGDCKGLSNYMKALLDVAGVKSHYTIVYAKNKKNIDKNFTSIQGNHIILNIPNNGNDIWLECTSQTMPFGFLGDFTDDRDVLVVTEEGGIIKRTAVYKDEENYQKIEATIQLTSDTNLKATVKRVSTGIQFDDKYYYNRLSKEDLDKKYIEDVWDYNNNLSILSTDLNVDKDSITLEENVEVSLESFATSNEQDYLFRVNIFNKLDYIPKRYRNRKLPLRISSGFKDEDIYHFTLPKGYVIDVLPPEKIIDTKFGAYKVVFTKVDKTHFTYYRMFILKENTYPKEDYSAYRSFLRSITKYDNIRIAINKKS